MTGQVAIRRLGRGDLDLFRAMNRLYAEAFEDPEHYLGAPPPDDWAVDLLADPGAVLLVAEAETGVVGALTAYILTKPERARREIYIYDLAVGEACRRRGIATALIDALRPIARACAAWVIYVQADHVDPPAIALYTKLGTREDVLHFDIIP